MNKKMVFWLLAVSLVLVLSIAEESMAQYTKEFIFCTDSSSPEACRGSQVLPNEEGIVIWGRNYGERICAGVGIEPQETACQFRGGSFAGFNCETRPFPFTANVPAGEDMAIACGDLSPLPNGNYSAGTTDNTCFEETRVCANFIVVTEAP